MGKQVEFYTSKAEGALLFQEILEKFDAQAIRSHAPKKELFTVVNIAEMDFDFIIPKNTFDRISFREYPIQGFVIGTSECETIQFSRRYQVENTDFYLVRFWFTAEPSALGIEKSISFLTWADKILKFVRKKYTLDKRMGRYLSPLALEAVKSGVFTP